MTRSCWGLCASSCTSQTALGCSNELIGQQTLRAGWTCLRLCAVSLHHGDTSETVGKWHSQVLYIAIAHSCQGNCAVLQNMSVTLCSLKLATHGLAYASAVVAAHCNFMSDKSALSMSGEAFHVVRVHGNTVWEFAGLVRSSFAEFLLDTDHAPALPHLPEVDLDLESLLDLPTQISSLASGTRILISSTHKHELIALCHAGMQQGAAPQSSTDSHHKIVRAHTWHSRSGICDWIDTCFCIGQGLCHAVIVAHLLPAQALEY